MKAYVVDTNYEWGAALVYALDAGQAKKFGGRVIDYEEFIDLKARREPHADKWANESRKPRIESDSSRLRDLGWRNEDGESCDCCGLHDISFGDEEVWAVCTWCQQCGECGHRDDCLHLMAATLFGLDCPDIPDLVDRIQFWKHTPRWPRYSSERRLMIEADL